MRCVRDRSGLLLPEYARGDGLCRAERRLARPSLLTTCGAGPGAANAAAAHDPNFASMVLGLHFDGANGGTSFPDQSNSNHTVTGNANAQTTTANFQFGGASGVLDGVADRWTIADTPNDFAFGSGDYAIYWWLRCAAVNDYDAQFSRWGGSNNDAWALLTRTTGVLELYAFAYTAGVAPVFSSSISVLGATFKFIELSRTSGTTYLFVDGVKDVQNAANTYTIANANNYALWIGNDQASTGRDIAANFDDLRVYKGVGGNTANYTPPTSPFLNS